MNMSTFWFYYFFLFLRIVEIMLYDYLVICVLITKCNTWNQNNINQGLFLLDLVGYKIMNKLTDLMNFTWQLFYASICQSASCDSLNAKWNSYFVLLSSSLQEPM